MLIQQCFTFQGFQVYVLIPFCPHSKKDWSKGTPKYAHFWNPRHLVRQLVDTPLNDSIDDMRTRLILCCRLFCLHRSIDLATVLRSLSFIDDKAFVLIKRKGWHCYNWEQMISIPDCPSISPLHLMIRYVTLTRLQGKPGGPLLLALKAPFLPLSSNRVGSLTKQILQTYGIQTKVWGGGVNLI